jgi:hypothetical protein
MITGLSTDKWTPFIDAKQFLAGGSARSAQPHWLDEEELALSGLQEKCQLEMKAEAEARRKARGDVGGPLEYPFPPSDIGGNPTLTVVTLEANRDSWTPSCGKLHAKSTAAKNVHRENVEKLRSAGDSIVTDWRAGNLQIKGRKVGGSSGEHEVIDPTITRLGHVEFRDVGDKVNGMRTDMFLVEDHGAYSTERRLYEDIVIERAQVINRDPSAGADTLNKELVTEFAGTQLPSLSPDGMPGVADPKVNLAKATESDLVSVRRNGPGTQKITLEAIAALGLEQIAHGLSDKELYRKIDTYCAAQTPPLSTPCGKTNRRALEKERIKPRKKQQNQQAGGQSEGA